MYVIYVIAILFEKIRIIGSMIKYAPLFIYLFFPLFACLFITRTSRFSHLLINIILIKHAIGVYPGRCVELVFRELIKAQHQ